MTSRYNFYGGSSVKTKDLFVKKQGHKRQQSSIIPHRETEPQFKVSSTKIVHPLDMDEIGPSKFMEHMELLYNDVLVEQKFETFNDFELTIVVVEDQISRAYNLHRCILAARVPFFQTKFSEDTTLLYSSISIQHLLPSDLSYENALTCVEWLFKYIYTGQLDVTQLVATILYSGTKENHQHLVLKCLIACLSICKEWQLQEAYSFLTATCHKMCIKLFGKLGLTSNSTIQELISNMTPENIKDDLNKFFEPQFSLGKLFPYNYLQIKVQQDVSCLFNDETWSDCIIQMEDELDGSILECHVNKCVLTVRCPSLQRKLEASRTVEYKLCNCNSIILPIFYFFYFDQVKDAYKHFAMEIITQGLPLFHPHVDRLEQDLILYTSEHLLNEENCVPTFQLANQSEYTLNRLKRLTSSFILSQLLDNISFEESTYFKELESEYQEFFLNKKAKHVFKAVVHSDTKFLLFKPTTSSSTTITINIALLGQLNTGKTATALTYTQSDFVASSKSAMQLNVYSKKNVSACGVSVNVNLYDVTTNPKDHRVSKEQENLLKQCDGFMILFTFDDKATFDSIGTIINQINQLKQVKKFEPIVLIGAKRDQGGHLERVESYLPIKSLYQITSDEAYKMITKQYKYSYFETSAKLNINIQESFNELLKEVLLDLYVSRKYGNLLQLKSSKEEEEEQDNMMRNSNQTEKMVAKIKTKTKLWSSNRILEILKVVHFDEQKAVEYWTQKVKTIYKEFPIPLDTEMKLNLLNINDMMQEGHYSEASELVEQLLHSTLCNTTPLIKSAVKYYKALLHFEMKQIDQVRSLAQESYAIYHQFAYKNGMFNCCFLLGKTYFYLQQDFEKALEQFFIAGKQFAKYMNEDLLKQNLSVPSKLCKWIGKCYEELTQDALALKWYDKSAKQSQAVNDEKGKLKSRVKMAHVLLKLDKTNEAIATLKTVTQHFDKHEAPDDKMRHVQYMAYEALASAYCKEKDSTLAWDALQHIPLELQKHVEFKIIAAQVMCLQSKWDVAVKLLQESLEWHQKNASSNMNRALVISLHMSMAQVNVQLFDRNPQLLKYASDAEEEYRQSLTLLVQEFNQYQQVLSMSTQIVNQIKSTVAALKQLYGKLQNQEEKIVKLEKEFHIYLNL